MYFDAEAYAEGICNSAAGSTIEVLVDTIRDTINALNFIEAQDEDEQETLDMLVGYWHELDDAIVQHEKNNEENTYFGE